MPSTISPEKVLRELSDLWVSLGKQTEGDGSAGVLRACSMTLAVIAEEADDPMALGETLAALNPEHPSRAIVIRLCSSAERSLSARVFAQCWMPFGQRRQICCEQIEIMASEAGLADLPPVVLPLAVPDLPVILWCRSLRIFQMPLFSPLAAIAQKLVIDSAAFPDQGAAMRQIAGSGGPGRLLADLAWTRLTRWRQLIAQLFENRLYLAHLPQVAQARIVHAGDATPVWAWYMGAWLLEGLHQTGSRAQLSFEPQSGARPGELSRVELIARNGQEMHFSIALVEGRTAEIRVDSLVNRTSLPTLSDYDLMRQELSIPGKDPVFERILPAAKELASAEK